MPLSLARLVALILGLTAFRSPATPLPPDIQIVSGSRPDGSATDLWLAILRRRLPPAAFDSVAAIRRRRSQEEAAWALLVEGRAADWPAEARTLQTLFNTTTVTRVTVVLGNRGGEDAMTHDSMTIAFDLTALQRVYGPATTPENADRLDRFFRHEFIHLLQKRWLQRHPFVPTGPLELALVDAWTEGLGNYYSLSARWQPTLHGPSPLTAKTLAELQPRFVARLVALACADSASAQVLLADLSAGPFDQKWGALPVALWLLADSQTNPDALRAFAAAGPTGIWALAERHLPPSLADSLRSLHTRPPTC